MIRPDETLKFSGRGQRPALKAVARMIDEIVELQGRIKALESQIKTVDMKRDPMGVALGLDSVVRRIDDLESYYQEIWEGNKRLGKRVDKALGHLTRVEDSFINSGSISQLEAGDIRLRLHKLEGFCLPPPKTCWACQHRQVYGKCWRYANGARSVPVGKNTGACDKYERQTEVEDE